MIEYLRSIYYRNFPFQISKLENILFDKDDLRLLSLQQKVNPLVALIEITKSCNLRCEYCPNRTYTNKNVFLDIHTYKSLIDQLPAGIELQPVGLGESSLHPDFPVMIEYASSRKKFRLISVTTNLTAKSSDYYINLFERGMDFLSFSIDTFNPVTINKTRTGTDLSKLILNTGKIASQFPDSTSAHLTITESNFPDLEDTLIKLIDLGVRRVTMKNVVNFNSDLASPSVTIEKVQDITARYADQINITLVPIEKCTRPFNEIAVDAYGNLFFCHYSFFDHWNGWGNIQDDLMKKYHSDEFNLLRRIFYKERPLMCKYCPYYPVI